MIFILWLDSPGLVERVSAVFSRKKNRAGIPAERISGCWIKAAIIFALSGAAAAQSPPDAGRILESLKPTPALPAPAHAPIVVPVAATPSAAEDTGPTLTVSRFIIEGAVLIPTATLEALLADMVGVPVTLGRIRAGAERITRHYQEAGYFAARAYLAPQTIENGEVRLTLHEGRFGAINLTNQSTDPERQLVKRMTATLDAQGIATQQPIARAALERGVLLLEDLVGAEVKATLRPGVTVGTGDLDLETRAKEPVSGLLGIDSYGSRYSGAWRANGGINLQHPFLAGDVLALRATHGDGLDFVLTAYQLPLGNDGLKLGLNASQMRYRLCCGAPATGSQGEAQTTSATLTYPLLLTQTRNVNLVGGLDHKTLSDDSSAGNISDKRVNVANLGVSAMVADAALMQRAEASLVLGHLDLARNPGALAQDQASAGSNGGYSKLRLGYTARLALTANDILQLRLSGQWAGKNLDSSEKISLGGIDGVRAYPTGEASGDNGMLARGEWSMPVKQDTLPGQFGISAFADAGYIRVNAKPWPAVATARNDYGLAGVGIGLTWSAPGGLTAAAALATPIGVNAGRVNGLDSDARSLGYRYWVMLNLPL